VRLPVVGEDDLIHCCSHYRHGPLAPGDMDCQLKLHDVSVCQDGRRTWETTDKHRRRTILLME